MDDIHDSIADRCSPLFDVQRAMDAFQEDGTKEGGLRLALAETRRAFAALYEDAVRLLSEAGAGVEEFIPLIVEIVENLDGAVITLKGGAPPETLAALRANLEALERELLPHYRDFNESRQRLSEERSFIEETLGRLTSEDYMTESFIRLHNAVLSVLHGRAPREELAPLLDELKTTLHRAQESLEATLITDDEWTMETAQSMRFLTEGLMLWHDGLELLRQGLTHSSMPHVDAGLERVAEGNRRLVITEEIGEYVNETMEKESRFFRRPLTI